MNTNKSLLSLLAIPTLLLSSPNPSLAATTNKTEVRQNQSTQLAQAPDYEYYTNFILQEISGALVGEEKFDEALRILERKQIDDLQSESLRSLIAVEAARAGKFDVALQTANSLEDEDSKAYALGEVAVFLAKAGEVEQALQIADSLPGDQQDKAYILGAIASSLAKAGEGERALQIAQSVEDQQDKAVVLAQAGALEEALQLVETLEESKQTETLGWMAKALARGGEDEQALKLAKSLPVNSFQGSILLDISSTLAEAGEWEQALEVAELIKNDYAQEDASTELVPDLNSISRVRNEALFRIADALTEAGKLEQALQVAQSIKAEDSEFDFNQQYVLGNIARELAIAGDFEKALEVARSTEDKSDDSDVAIELAKAGNLDAARQIAASLENEYEEGYHKVSILKEVAAQLTNAGKLDEAKEIVQSVESEEDQGTILISIVQALAKAGQVEEALQLAQQAPEDQKMRVVGGVAEVMALTAFLKSVNILQSLENNEAKIWVMRNTAVALAVAGQVDRALQLAESVEIPYYNPASASLLGTVAVNFAKLGNLDRALEITKSIDESYRWRTLGDIAIELATAGEVEQSLALAESVDQYQDSLFAVVASKLAEVGEVEQALQLSENKEDADSQANILGGIAVGLGVRGDFDRGLAIAQSIEEDDVKAGAMGEIIVELIQAQKFAQGMAVTQSLNQSVGNTNSKALVLQAIGINFAQEKQFDLAMQVVEMLDFQPEDENPIVVSGLHMGILRVVATSQAEIGNVDEALQIAESLDAGDQVLIFHEVVRVLVASGESDRALQLAQSLDFNYDKSVFGDLDKEYVESILGTIAIALVKEGDVDKGLELARSLEEYQQIAAITEIAGFWIEEGEIEQALQLTKTIKDYPTWASSSVAVKLAQAGEIELAMEIAESIQDQYKDLVLAHVAGYFAQEGDIDKAKEIIQSLDEQESLTLGSVVLDLVEQEKLEVAKQLILFLPDNFSKASLLNQLATNYIEAGNKQEATQLLNEALAIIN